MVAFLGAVMEGTQWVYDVANDEKLSAMVKDLTQAEGKYVRQALEYMRAKKVFPPDLAVSDTAFDKSLELMRKANLADDRLEASARLVLDDSYRVAALKSLSVR